MDANTNGPLSAAIAALYYYPIKGAAGVAVTQATLDAQGIRYDRRWMLVGPQATDFWTQRELPHLARVAPLVSEAGDTLTVNAPGRATFILPLRPDAELGKRPATVWGFTGTALDEGDDVARWFSDALQSPCRLVRTPENFTRRVRSNSGNEDRVGFADDCPLLLASETSLADVNAHLITRDQLPVPMNRFRANVVVRGLPTWAEDDAAAWRIRSSGLTFRSGGPCARCAVTTVDQEQGVRTGPEPLSTLATFRRDANGKVLFGVYLLLDNHHPNAVLRVGDVLELSV